MYYDAGNSRGYSTPARYGSYGGGGYLGSSYNSPKPYSSYESPKYNAGGVKDKIGKFGGNLEPRYEKYSPLASRSSISRGDNYGGYDRRSSYSAGNDPHGGRSGYLSDYGGSTHSLASWDRGSSKSGRSYGGRSRESSPVSSRSSRYDSSPYSTYGSHKGGTDVSPVAPRKYERTSSRTSDYGMDYPRRYNRQEEYDSRRPSRDPIRVPPPKQTASSTSGSESDSDNSAPEAEKNKTGVKYVTCRGTSPIPDESVNRETKPVKEKEKSISTTKRVKYPLEETKNDRFGRVSRSDRVPSSAAVDCSMQTTEQEKAASRRGKYGGAGSGGAVSSGYGSSPQGPSETYYKYRDKFVPSQSTKTIVPTFPSPSPPKSPYKDKYYEKSIPDVPEEKAWRKAVYGDTQPSRSSNQRHDVLEQDADGDNDRYGKKRHPRTSTPKDPRKETDRRTRGSDQDDRSGYGRSSSREGLLDEKPRRKRHGSKEILDEQTSLTPENLSVRDSIDKVHNWKQNLPDQKAYYDEQHNHDDSRHVENYPSGYSHRDAKHPQKSNSGPIRYSRQDSVHSGREGSPPYSRETSPGRKSTTQYRRSQTDVDNVFEENDHHNLPNKDFRKSDLNKAEYDKIYGRDGHGFHRQHSKQHIKKSGSSSDAFSRDESPNRMRRLQNQSSQEQRRIGRDSSREDIADDKRSRREKDGGQVSDSSQFGFNREGSPNRTSTKHRPSSRQGSKEDILDEREESRQLSPYLDSRYGHQNDLAVSNESLADISQADMPHSISQHSVSSLADIIPGTDGDQNKDNKHQMKNAYISKMQDIDNLLDFSPNEEEFVENGKFAQDKAPGTKTKTPSHYIANIRDIDDLLADRPRTLMDTSVPRHPKPMKPHPAKVSTFTKPTGAPSLTSQQMMSMLQEQKGFVTITDILGLCVQPPKPKFIRVPGSSDDDVNFAGFDTVDDMLDSLGVDVRKVGEFISYNGGVRVWGGALGYINLITGRC